MKMTPEYIKNIGLTLERAQKELEPYGIKVLEVLSHESIGHLTSWKVKCEFSKLRGVQFVLSRRERTNIMLQGEVRKEYTLQTSPTAPYIFHNSLEGVLENWQENIKNLLDTVKLSIEQNSTSQKTECNCHCKCRENNK